MSGDDEDEDGSDWLSSQFDATAQVPAQVPATPIPAAPTPVPPPPVAATPPAAPPASAAPAAATAPPAPVASAPEPNANGGFSWGLRPGGSVVEPPASPAAVQPPAVAEPPMLAPPVVLPPVAEPPAVAPPVVETPTAVTPPLVAPPASTPYVGPPTEPYVAEPTKPLSWDEFASTQQQSAPVAPIDSFPQATEAYTVQPWQPAAAASPASPPSQAEPAGLTEDAHEQTSAIDSLFGDHKFQDYEEVGVLQTIQVPPTTQVAEPVVVAPREPLSGTQKALMGVAAGLIAVLILIGLFFLGQHLGTAAAATPVPKTTGSAASATPTPAGTGGPVAPGVRQWSTLQGGECIQPFTSAWAVSFTVVACTADHDAEMVFKGTLPASSGASYPSASAFQKEITPLCSAPTAINYAAAVSVTDLQVSFSYPPNTATWLKGDRTYYCFVDRVSGGNLPGDLSVPKSK